MMTCATPFLRAAAVLALSAAACAPTDDAGVSAAPALPDEVPEWPVAAEPVLQIGVVEGDPNYQFHGLLSAVALPDGRIAVLNAGSHELRIYDGTGRFVSKSGRRGGGPGEFQRPLRVHLLGDTLAVYDLGLNRLSLHTLDGTFLGVREVSTERGRFALDEWLYNRSWIDGPPLGQGRAAVMAALPHLPAPDSIEGYRYVRVSPYGHLWVRQSAPLDASTRPWHVHDLAGKPLARVEVPAELEVYDIGPDHLLGRSRDSLGVEYLRMHPLDSRGAMTARYPFTGAAVAAADVLPDSVLAAAMKELKGALRMLTGQQEIYYSNPANSYTYADDHRKLTGYEVPKGVRVRIVNGHERGWTAVAVHDATGAICGVSYGLTPPPGWTPGVASCADGETVIPIPRIR